MRAQRLRSAAPPGSDVFVSAPGRANLMGEYTDINEGRVLPVALDLRTDVAGRRVDAATLSLRSLDLPDDGTVQVDLGTGAGPGSGWGRYATAVVRVLLDAGLPLRGVEGVLSTDVPIGAGLSSSAALEVAVALTVLDQPVEPLRLAQLCRRAENEGVGVQSGLMDQLASTAAGEGTALLLDCRDLRTEHVPVPDALAVLVVDSGTSRSLASSAYNDRRAECALAADGLGVASLRDATPAGLQERWDDLDDVVRRRARHVITEDARVLETAAALRRCDTAALGALMAASHASMSGDFEISTPELDLLVAAAVATPGVVGSRMTGGGFGGCTVSLVEAGAADEVRDEVCRRYEAAGGPPARAWVSRPAAGAWVR